MEKCGKEWQSKQSVAKGGKGKGWQWMAKGSKPTHFYIFCD